MKIALILLILLNICHFLGDFSHFSMPFMLKAKRFGKPILPIVLHALVHSVLMMMVFIAFDIRLSLLILLFFIQLISHTLIDVAKGRINGKYILLQNPANPLHWYIFGFDQLLHQLIIILMVYISQN